VVLFLGFLLEIVLKTLFLINENTNLLPCFHEKIEDIINCSIVTVINVRRHRGDLIFAAEQEGLCTAKHGINIMRIFKCMRDGGDETTLSQFFSEGWSQRW
jgi:hypothetical protein